MTQKAADVRQARLDTADLHHKSRIKSLRVAADDTPQRISTATSLHSLSISKMMTDRKRCSGNPEISDAGSRS